MLPFQAAETQTESELLPIEAAETQTESELLPIEAAETQTESELLPIEAAEKTTSEFGIRESSARSMAETEQMAETDHTQHSEPDC